jgi:uncharacterized protein (DUF4415 family)
MDEKKRSTEQDWIDPDDAPDLSTPYWQEIVLAEPVSRGRPRIPNPKVSTTLRLDVDVIEHFRKDGPGWQSRINAALREAMMKRT